MHMHISWTSVNMVNEWIIWHAPFTVLNNRGRRHFVDMNALVGIINMDLCRFAMSASNRYIYDNKAMTGICLFNLNCKVDWGVAWMNSIFVAFSQPRGLIW